MVEPQFRHTEQDPAGTVRAPQSMQGSKRDRMTTISGPFSPISICCSDVIR